MLIKVVLNYVDIEFNIVSMVQWPAYWQVVQLICVNILPPRCTNMWLVGASQSPLSIIIIIAPIISVQPHKTTFHENPQRKKRGSINAKTNVLENYFAQCKICLTMWDMQCIVQQIKEEIVKNTTYMCPILSILSIYVQYCPY